MFSCRLWSMSVCLSDYTDTRMGARIVGRCPKALTGRLQEERGPQQGRKNGSDHDVSYACSYFCAAALAECGQLAHERSGKFSVSSPGRPR